MSVQELHRQQADLLVEFSLIPFDPFITTAVAARNKRGLSAVQKRLLPSMNPVRMNAITRCKLGHRRVAFDRCKATFTLNAG